MKSVMRSSASMVIALSLFGAMVAAPVAAQDKSKMAPAAAADKSKPAASNQKVIFENDKVKVFETRFKPGESSANRERPTRVVRALTDGHLQRTYPDGRTEKVEWKAGETRWLPKESFGNKNIGKNEVVLFVVEVK